MPIKMEIECTFFDQKRICSVCGARPVMRITGMCAPHSVTPYDEGRRNDWIDCYAGCAKHDFKARNARTRSESRANSSDRVPDYPDGPTPIPTLDRLYRLSKHPVESRDALLKQKIIDAIKSRGLLFNELALTMGKGREYWSNRLSSARKIPIGFMDICDLIIYLHDYDKAKKEHEYGND